MIPAMFSTGLAMCIAHFVTGDAGFAAVGTMAVGIALGMLIERSLGREPVAQPAQIRWRD